MRNQQILAACLGSVLALVFFLTMWESTGLRGAYLHHNVHLIPEDYIYEPSKIMILQVNDARRNITYQRQVASVKCWAESHGYQHHHVMYEENTFCMDRITIEGKTKYYYMYLCVMWQLMEDNPDIEYFVQVDGDVVAGMNHVSLERWIDGADVIVQHRLYTNEIAGGTMMVRNTTNGLSWVQNFLSFVSSEPKGFSGNDNGSIQLAILDMLRLPGRMECRDIYNSLDTFELLPYFEEFLDCCMKVLGPPRRWDRKELGHRPRVTIWPAGVGWLEEYVFVSGLNPEQLMPIHHNIKRAGEAEVKVYGPHDTWGVKGRDGLCIGHIEAHMDAGESVKVWEREMKRAFYEHSVQLSLSERVRKWDPAGSSMESCFHDWSQCEPLDALEEAPGLWLKFTKVESGFEPEWGPEGENFTSFDHYWVV